jgi:hypothetical protein
MKCTFSAAIVRRQKFLNTEGVNPKMWRRFLKPLEKAILVLNAASFGYALRKYTGRETWMGKTYFAVENIQVIAEGASANRFYNLSNMCLV